MMDDFGLYPREEAFDPFGVMLFKALQVVSFLFFLALLAVSPESKDGKIDSKAEFIITMDWPDNHPDDLDLFVQDPAGNIAWYRHREAGFLTLDRDDRGGVNDFITVNGRKIASPIREEIVTVRGILAGEYTVNVSHFQAKTGQPVPVNVKVQKLNPTAQVIFDDKVFVDHTGAEKTAVRFTLDFRRQGDRCRAAAEIAAGDVPQRKPERRGPRSQDRRQDENAVSNLQSDILMLSVAYALVGALLLVVLVYARLPWSLKGIAVIVTSSFYIASFLGMRALLGWASVDRLPPSFKLLQARIVEPHSLEGDPGAIYLWVEALDDGNRPSGVPRAYRIPYSDKLADKTDKAQGELAAGRAQGGRAADYGSGEGGLLDAVRAYITPNTIIETSGGDPSTGGGLTAVPQAGDEVTFTPLLPPRMPPKDVIEPQETRQ